MNNNDNNDNNDNKGNKGKFVFSFFALLLLASTARAEGLNQQKVDSVIQNAYLHAQSAGNGIVFFKNVIVHYYDSKGRNEAEKGLNLHLNAHFNCEEAAEYPFISLEKVEKLSNYPSVKRIEGPPLEGGVYYGYNPQNIDFNKIDEVIEETYKHALKAEKDLESILFSEVEVQYRSLGTQLLVETQYKLVDQGQSNSQPRLGKYSQVSLAKVIQISQRIGVVGIRGPEYMPQLEF